MKITNTTKILWILILTNVWNASQAQNDNFTPPSYCSDGRSSNDIKAEAPSFVAVSVARRFKNDGRFTLDVGNHEVAFTNSSNGLMGYSSPNGENNSYLSASFQSNARGLNYLWTEKVDNSSLTLECSKASFYVQELPEVNLISLEFGNAVVSYSIDEYSKAGINSSIKPTIKLYGRSIEGSEISGRVNLSNLEGTLNINFTSDYAGTNFRVFVEIYDGTYRSTRYLGNVTGGTGPHRPCPNCEIDI